MNYEKKVVAIARGLETLGAIAAALAMFGCGAFGVFLIGSGFFVACRGLFSGVIPSAQNLIIAVLAGLEMFFLAPLPILALSSVTELYRAMIAKDPVRLESAETLVGKAKQLITGLMIAVVSTEILHRIIAGGDLEAKTVVAILGLIAALSLYYWVSTPKAASRDKAHGLASLEFKRTDTSQPA